MELIVNGEYKNISLRAWEGTRYGQDFFADVEHTYRDGDELTAEEYEALIDWWKSEVGDKPELGFFFE